MTTYIYIDEFVDVRQSVHPPTETDLLAKDNGSLIIIKVELDRAYELTDLGVWTLLSNQHVFEGPKI